MTRTILQNSGNEEKEQHKAEESEPKKTSLPQTKTDEPSISEHIILEHAPVEKEITIMKTKPTIETDSKLIPENVDENQWNEYQTEAGELYYHHLTSNTTTWDRPSHWAPLEVKLDSSHQRYSDNDVVTHHDDVIIRQQVSITIKNYPSNQNENVGGSNLSTPSDSRRLSVETNVEFQKRMVKKKIFPPVKIFFFFFLVVKRMK